MDNSIRKNQVMFSGAALRKLILPLIAEQLLAMLVGMADTMMISYAGESAISGVALVDMINTLVITILSAVATGGAVVVSQYLGKRDGENLPMAAGQLHTIAFAVSLALMAVCLAFHRGILHLLFGAVTAEVMQAAIPYFVVSAFSFPFLGLYNASAAVFRSIGKTNITMLVSLLMNAINIVGNYLGIFVFHAGVMGVAVPTLISRAVAGVLMFALALKPGHSVSFGWKHMLCISRDMDRRIMKIAVPGGVENGLFTLGRVLVTSIVAMFGTSQIAANSVAQSVDGFSIIFVNAMNLAMITVVGQCVGAGEYGQASHYVKKMMGISYVSTMALSLVIGLFLPAILGLYELSDDTWNMCYWLIMTHNIMAVLLHPTSFNLANGLRAAGDAKFTMVVGIASMLVFRIGTAVLVGAVMKAGIWGVWAAMGMDWLGRSAAFLWRFKSGKWKECRMV